jgi:nitrate/TMAO reductase-like tetraheme cytochrome c subunit
LNNKKNIDLDNEIENEPAPSFLDEMRAIGNFIKKLFRRTENPSVEREAENPSEESQTENSSEGSGENPPAERETEYPSVERETENPSAERENENPSEESKKESSTVEKEENPSTESEKENSFEVSEKDESSLENDGNISFRDEKKQSLIEIKKDNKNVAEKDEEDDEDDDEDNQTPSFKDEIKSIGLFFKRIFGSSEKLSSENKEYKSVTEEQQDEHTNLTKTETSKSKQIISTEEESNIVELLSDDEEEEYAEKPKKRKWFSKKNKPQLTEEQIQEKKVKLYKGLTSTFVFLFIFFTISFFGFTSTSKKEFCKSCHEMRPEHYTLMASSHSDVECVDCHTNPGLEEMFKEKARTAGMFFNKLSNRVEPPIVTKRPIDDAACNKCHDMKKRAVTHEGDWIIPHDRHANNGIACVDCHSGVAHGQIADRNLTQKKNLSQWNEIVGKSAMSDERYTKLTMDECMNCHMAREITTKCEGCHSTGMVPESHKKTGFVDEGTHGTLARDDIEKCHKCHAYNTPDPIEVVQESTKNNNGIKIVSKEKNVMTVENYVLENKFCRDCHRTKPKSHEGNFFKRHGSLASKNDRKCYSCHPATQMKSRRNAVTGTTCRTCHPAKHAKNFAMYRSHPVPLKKGDKIDASCFRCHSRSACAKCHKEFRQPGD